MQIYPSTPRRHGALMLGAAALALLAACQTPFDIDLRNRGDGFSTAPAAQQPTARPRPDDRGVISYPGYQVVAAQRGDTVRAIAGRLGLDAATLARYNGVEPDVTLRRDEIIALPERVAEPSPATGAAGSGPILPAAPINVTALADAAIDRAGPQTVTPAAAPTPAAPAAPQTGQEPIRHQVMRGETAYSLARLYNVPVRSLADWNGLGPNLTIREGQFLLIPVGGAAAPPRVADAAAPGAGSLAPEPPSAAAPLPPAEPSAAAAAATATAATPPVADLGSQQTTPPRSAQMVYPVQGSIIRAYARGRNDGIDIGAPAGTPVRAAAAGTVAAVTTNTEGIRIVVIKHADNLLTVYTHLDNLTVAKDATVTQGQTIGQVRAGDPSFLHFEVRRGMESTDPTGFLP